MWGGAGLLALLCVVFGVAPFLVLPAVVDAAASGPGYGAGTRCCPWLERRAHRRPRMLAPGLLALGLVGRRGPGRRRPPARPARRGAAHRGVGVRAGGPDGAHAVHGDVVRRAVDPGVRRRARARPTTSTSATAPSRATTSSRRRSTPRSTTPSSATATARSRRARLVGPMARRVPNGSVHRYLAFGLAALSSSWWWWR